MHAGQFRIDIKKIFITPSKMSAKFWGEVLSNIIETDGRDPFDWGGSKS